MLRRDAFCRPPYLPDERLALRESLRTDAATAPTTPITITTTTTGPQLIASPSFLSPEARHRSVGALCAGAAPSCAARPPWPAASSSLVRG
ncbi:hypothetical protein [Streptomyces lunalinharesii]|uniref:Uncharacterized protein n=1 Tax=Streptomyces lunalinharesii TaxID=333384 RepID=A0ABN3RKL7_9ACTN